MHKCAHYAQCSPAAMAIRLEAIASRSKDATRGSWPYYYEQEATRNKGHRY